MVRADIVMCIRSHGIVYGGPFIQLQKITSALSQRTYYKGGEENHVHKTFHYAVNYVSENINEKASINKEIVK